MWVDMADDIIAKTEAHFKSSSGSTTDYVKQLQSVDLTSPAEIAGTKLPAGFTLDPAGLQQSCGGL